MLLDHAVRTNIGVSAAGSEMNGLLKYCNGTQRKPSYTSNGLGFYTIGDLLAGATIGSKAPTASTCGLQLDDPSVVQTSRRSARYDGIVLEINIEYQNTLPWSGVLPGGQVDYVLTASVVNNTKSKIEEEIWVEYPAKRVTRNRHGIKIVVVQTGRLGGFSAAALLTTFTSSLALLAVATTGVDFLAMYVLARKGIYKSAKYENINEKYLEELEAKQAQRDDRSGANTRWDYEPPINGVGSGDDTSSEPLHARINPYGGTPSKKVDNHSWD